MPPLIDNRIQPIFKAPMFPPTEWTMASLRQHLQAALCLELSTIPLYLFAGYSINTEGNNKGVEKSAQKTILGIVKEEMLHLTIVGNCLTALGGRPQLYGEAFAPTYPSRILYEGVLMTLAPARQTQIENFMELEQPVDLPTTKGQNQPIIGWEAPTYKSIGDFYQHIIKGIEKLDARITNGIFDPNSEKRQWGPADSGAPPHIAIIKDKTSALQQLNLVIAQGEGGPKEPLPDSHYGKFLALSEREKDLDVYRLAPNPFTSEFKEVEETYAVMLAFDAAYSYLLWSIEAIWSYQGPDDGMIDQLKGNVDPLMTEIMSPFARFLVKQKLRTIKGKNAAPPFNLYSFDLDSSPKNQLGAIIKGALNAYPNAPEFRDIGDALDALCDLGDV
ncbi:unnamed protein product [Rhizoctonia solani]|uniref:Iminophenyl-pyruvate dimer synthase domain-containing protein n=1 Tax=Rhizoctonia solani TaxID=456999 RepID=A0A8H3HMG0_9AGAM|nr:unnamed protein product [Rhizoctonia solani]CAE7084319.1 unnamed protein product [Rhizoctonia solani]